MAVSIRFFMPSGRPWGLTQSPLNAILENTCLGVPRYVGCSICPKVSGNFLVRGPLLMTYSAFARQDAKELRSRSWMSCKSRATA